MGNETSVEMEGDGSVLQQQDTEHLWKIVLDRGRDEEGTGVSVFTRRPGVGTIADLCESGLEHLRLLRHPNILKFVGCDVTDDCIAMVTEPIVPVYNVLESISAEGLVMGWRGVASGLAFLHTKAGLTHGNLSVECVFVSTIDSSWKIGGFEAAAKHKSVDSNFLSSVSSVRHEKATPPEDKSATPPKPGSVPYHSRDIWAFGHFILATIEDSTADRHISDGLFTYVQDEMLNPDPHHRPTANDVINQPWMNNRVSKITDFLSKLTLKSQADKDQFFMSLAGHLHSLPQTDVAEHIVPLLVTPLVMVEPLARTSLWKHLLHPIKHTTPRPEKFDTNSTCPLLDDSLFSAHVIPLLLNLLESRDLHVRSVLLEHLASFSCVISQEDLHSVVLPEVLVGLSDSRDEIIQATLHALADLVPLLGSEAIIGDRKDRSTVFSDSMPRGKGPPVTPVVVSSAPKKSSLSLLSGAAARVDGGQRSTESRKERMEQMKAKREQQRLKRNAQKKLGGKVVDAETPLLDDQDSDPPPGNEAPPTSSAPQYSPSVSHDEEHWNDVEDISGTSSMNSPMMSSKLGEPPQKSKANNLPESDEEEEQWEEFEEERTTTPGGDDWNQTESWTQSWSEGQRSTVQSSQRSGGMKLKLSSNESNQSEKPLSPPVRSHQPTKKSFSSLGKKPAAAAAALDGRLKGRLSDKDIERLQEQLSWSTEPDFFADMAPSISGGSTTGKQGIVSAGKIERSKVEEPLPSSALQYQPSEEVGGGWGEEEEWEEF